MKLLKKLGNSIIFQCYFVKTDFKPREWLQEARDNCHSDFEVFLVGTKRDLVVSSCNNLTLFISLQYL